MTVAVSVWDGARLRIVKKISRNLLGKQGILSGRDGGNPVLDLNV